MVETTIKKRLLLFHFFIHLHDITMGPDLHERYYSIKHYKNTLIFAEDQVVKDDAEDEWQRAVFTLQNTGKHFGT